ncbi:hypothetical protein [Ornithobacterium rhinotracheale]|uniref:Uncharacterized protein n=1 Tax=Ornithobacterium rhinotracheale (strain ATCC 51463 / DSM 15997 / CCUG 23171 / CIP 104009 / LMG 9086) TaxID=867902 RepID=I4A344_ORNRL|nr:hypothetical protein [Ornithobacterium rhinotracheale]AFL98378.1 hypothetical protein Ornrh_2247 [Ornithobacterium rhinotracheale DSM 15997]AIQ00741.1 hypothetical protein Q785_11375 [Ornithobacterium rhinotracheale ORT-UMN 88]KGB65825.1 hypothetical protein Q787_10900 [Ornithobacterium rhinotracheale H06-030791]MCK0193274.1 hypothetical protein [Ornithobacterium rhinotracheale]MCK0201145.1 hypothetical protein [Ornithobacterium rhinotracheale]
MKKILSLINLIGLAKALFEKNENLEKLYATEDGQFFEDENRALLHAENSKMKIHKILRAVALSAVTGKKTMPANKQEKVEETTGEKESAQESGNDEESDQVVEPSPAAKEVEGKEKATPETKSKTTK